MHLTLRIPSNETEMAIRVQIVDDNAFHFSIIPFSLQLGRLGSLDLVKQSVKEENSESKSAVLRLRKKNNFV